MVRWIEIALERSGAQQINSRQAVLLVLHADTPPDVRLFSSKAQRAFQQRRKAISTLGQNLVGMPIRSRHHTRHLDDVFVGNVLVKQVAHGVHENHPGRSPTQWIAELFQHDAQIKAKLKWMAGNAAPTFGKRLGVTVLAAGANLGTATNWIPCRIRPLDFRFVAHNRIERVAFQEVDTKPSRCRKLADASTSAGEGLQPNRFAFSLICCALAFPPSCSRMKKVLAATDILM